MSCVHVCLCVCVCVCVTPKETKAENEQLLKHMHHEVKILHKSLATQFDRKKDQ